MSDSTCMLFPKLFIACPPSLQIYLARAFSPPSASSERCSIEGYFVPKSKFSADDILDLTGNTGISKEIAKVFSA